MKFNGFADLSLEFLDGVASSDTTGKVGNVCGIVLLAFSITIAYFKGDSLFESSLFQDAVQPTRGQIIAWLSWNSDTPGFDPCLNWRWLPFVATRYQPSS